MSPFERARRHANELRRQAYLAEDAGYEIQARALHEAADEALSVGKRTERLTALLETLAERASRGGRDLRRWSLALWVLGAKVRVLRAARRSAARFGGLAS